MELNDLYKIYQANIKVDQVPFNENLSPIKVGDILVALYNGREIRGEVSSVYEGYYVLKGKNSTSVKITIDDITEHYPKNTSFENRGGFKKLNESFLPPVEKTPSSTDSKKNDKQIQKVQSAKKRIIDEQEDDEMKNSPDNQVDLSIEHVKTIGQLVYYTDVKYSDINKMFEKDILSKNKYWYLLTEKPGEIHVIRNNEKAFQIQPFVNALVEHFLKSQDRMVHESYGKIKVSGNDDFSIITNIPQNVHKELLNSIIGLLSGVKK
jgi:hypothetical protein